MARGLSGAHYANYKFATAIAADDFKQSIRLSPQFLARSGVLWITLQSGAELCQGFFSPAYTEQRPAELIVGLRPLGRVPDSFAEATDGCRNIPRLQQGSGQIEMGLGQMRIERDRFCEAFDCGVIFVLFRQ